MNPTTPSNQPSPEDSGAVKMPSGLTRFELPDGQAFELDVVEFIDTTDKLYAANVADPSRTHYDYLAAIIGLVNDRAGVLLTPGQADWLKDETRNIHLKKKLQQASDIRDTQNSLFSMASTRSN